MEENIEQLEQPVLPSPREAMTSGIFQRQGEVAPMFAQLRAHSSESTPDTRVSLPIAMANNLHQTTIYDPSLEQLSEADLLKILTASVAPKPNTSILLEAAKRGLVYDRTGSSVGIVEKDDRLFVVTDGGKNSKELITALVGDDPLYVAPETLTLLADIHHQYQDMRARSRSEVREYNKSEQEKVIETVHAIIDHLATMAPVFQTQTARAKDRPSFKSGIYVENYAISYEIKNIAQLDPQAYARLIQLIEQLPEQDTQEPSVHSIHYARILSQQPFIEICDKLTDVYDTTNQGKSSSYGSPRDIAQHQTPQVIGFTRYK